MLLLEWRAVGMGHIATCESDPHQVQMLMQMCREDEQGNVPSS